MSKTVHKMWTVLLAIWAVNGWPLGSSPQTDVSVSSHTNQHIFELHGDVQQFLSPCEACQLDTSEKLLATSPLVSYASQPAVIPITTTTLITFTFATDGSVTQLTADLESGGTLTATLIAPNIYQLVFTPAQVLYAYATGYNHNFFGFLNVQTGATLWGSLNLFVNVSDATIPSVVYTDLALDARATPHAVNLKIPNAPPGTYNTDIGRRLYQLYPDVFDFINLVYIDSTIDNRSHGAISNRVQGIGISLFEGSADWGSAGRLIGVSNFPSHLFFDGADDGYQHELGHQWINFALDVGTPHWPISELAQGFMGLSIPGTSVGGMFPFNLIPNGNGSYTLHYNANLRQQVGFTDLDLYLMGLLPATSVQPALVFTNQNQSAQLFDGGVLQGPTYTVDANTIIASQGPRVPDSVDAPNSFSIATIIVTRDRLLTGEEMMFFDHMAARASLTQAVPSQVGRLRQTAKPFYLASDSLGSLTTTMVPFTHRVSLPLVRR